MTPSDVMTQVLERASRFSTCSAALLLVVALLAIHPDLTPTLQALGVVALLAGWAAGRRFSDEALAASILTATIGPVLLRLATGREGPVLDIVWMAGLAGALLRSQSWTSWNLPPLWRPLLGGWTLALALVWPVLAAREVGFDLAGLSDRGATVSWADWSTAPWSAPRAIGWIFHWVLAQLLGVLWCDWLTARFIARDAMPRAAHALWICATIAGVAALAQGTIDLSLLSNEFWAVRGRAVGTMLDANAYGHVAALAGPVAFLALRRLAPSIPALASLALALNGVGVWMSGSRTALLCAVAGVAGLAIGAWRARRPAGSRPRIAITVALVSAAALIAIMTDAIGPLRRLAEFRADRQSVAALWERGGYGSIAMQIVREYPLTGTGAGTYHFLAPDYWRAQRNRNLPSDNAQNWWRHQGAELGLFGGAAVLVWSAVLAWRVFAGRRNLPAGSPARPVVRMLLVGIGASSMLGVPTQSPVVLLWFFFLVAWLDVLLGGDLSSPAPRTWTRMAWPVTVALAIGYAGMLLVLAHGPLSVTERARRFTREYVVGTEPPQALPEGGAFRWTGERSRFYVPARTRWVLLRLWAHHPDITENPVDVTITTPCGLLWQESLRTSDSVTIGVALPLGSAFEAAFAVSRTWRPIDYGKDDTRRLGVAVLMEFVDDPAQVRALSYTPDWPACATAGTAVQPTSRR